MKKSTKIKLALLAVLFICTLAIVSCDFTHSHSYSLVVTPATCTERGYTTYTCICKYGYVDNYVDPTGHILISHNAKTPTCTEIGWESYETCSKCDYSTYVELKGEHTPGEWIIDEEATAIANGSKHKECTHCGATVETSIVPMLTHSYVSVVTEPTCTEQGYTTHTCSKCGYNYVGDYVDALGHRFKNWVVVNEPTLTTEGLQEGTCECGRKNTRACGYHSNYYYSVLGSMPNGSKMQALYKQIDESAVEFHSNTELSSVGCAVATIDYTTLGLTWEEASTVWYVYRYDHPLYYWMANTADTDGIHLFIYAYDEYANGADREKYNQIVYDGIKEYAEYVANDRSLYRIAWGLHDKIIYSIDYAYEPDSISQTPEDDAWAHNVLGVFEKNSGVCESYALTFHLLLNYCGVESIVALGSSFEQAHAWNLAKMDDGNWYWFDLTWDDQPNIRWGIEYDYFCVNENNWSDHTLYTPDDLLGKILSSLPERSNDAAINTAMHHCFTASWDNMSGTFEIVGYNTVELISAHSYGDFILPETIRHEDETYKVIAIDLYKGINSETTCLVLPKTIQYIGDFSNMYLEQIVVDNNNPYYTSRDGVLFTKSLYTLIAYPLANERTKYFVPTEVEYIFSGAFGHGGVPYLKEIVMRRDTGIGLLCFDGRRHEDGPYTGGGIHIVDIDISYRGTMNTFFNLILII